MSLIEQAVRQQLRFNFMGGISVEQLFNMKKTTLIKEELITLEDELKASVASYGQNNRRTSMDKKQTQKDEELRLAIVSQLLDELEAAEKAEKEKELVKEKRQVLFLHLGLLAAKEAGKQKELSIEEIRAQLESLK